MSEYPTALHPSTSHDFNKDDQQIFTDYGCWESVDVEFTEADVSVFARKNRTSQFAGDSFSHSSESTIDTRVLVPVHDFLTTENPVEIRGLLVDNIDYGDVLGFKHTWDPQKTRTRKRGQCISGTRVMTLPVQQYVTNLINDHSDVCGETFDRLTNRMAKTQTGIFLQESANSLKNLVDYSSCDVGRKLLRNIVIEEAQNDLLRRYSDRDYTGGCISFKPIKQRKNKQYGITVCAQGQCLEDLCIKILNINIKKQDSELSAGELSSSNDNVCLSHSSFLDLQFGSEIRQTLNGRVCQIDVGGYESCDDIIIGTRSDYHVLLHKFSKSSTDWNDQDFGDFCSKRGLECLGLLKTTGSARVSSIAVNPFIPGECAVSTEDSCVRLWTPEVNKNADGTTENLEVLINGTLGGLCSDNPWRQVSFAAHPRQLLIADDQNVSLFDIRTQNSSTSLLNILTSRHVKQDEKIYCIENCCKAGNEYGCLVATNYNLFLMDQRFCGEPLLQWGTNMSFPPHYIRTAAIDNLDRQHEFSALPRWSFSTSAVVVGNQHPQEIYSYQMCKTMKHSTSPKHYAPQAVGPPRILGSFRDLRHYMKRVSEKHCEYLENRSSKMAVGIEAIPISNESTSGMIVLQITSVGDIGYQTLCLKNSDEAYDMANLITGKTSATFITEKEKNKQACLKKIQRQNYDLWIKNVTKTQQTDYQDVNNNMCILNRYYSQHMNVNISAMHPNSLLSQDHMPSTESCPLCFVSREISEEPDDTVPCQKCGTNVERVTNVIEKLKFQSTITQSTPESADRDVAPPNLINLDVTGDEYDNELGRLLKATWNTSYEEYWKTLRKVEEKRQVDEKLEQIRQTFDLSQRSELNGSPNQKIKKDLKRSMVSENGKEKNRNSPSRKRKKYMEQPSVSDSPPSTSFLSWLTSSQEPSQNGTSSTNSAQDISHTTHSLRPLPDASILNNETISSGLGASGSFTNPTGFLPSPSKSAHESPSFTFFSPRKNNPPSENLSFRSQQRTSKQYHSQSKKTPLVVVVPFKTTKRKSLSQHSVGF